MPSWDKSRKQWRGQRHRADFPTKKEAAAWEVERKKEFEKAEQTATPTDTDLLTFCNRYLDHAKLRFTPKTFSEKNSLCKRFLKRIGNLAVTQVTEERVLDYLSLQAKSRSANVYNRDRKNLLAMWTWGVRILKFKTNPVASIDKLPHERGPQHTPTTEEVLQLLAAATREETVFLNCILQTGARRSEIFRWTWADDINFDRREIRLGTRKTKDGSMEYEFLPMNDKLYEELWWWWSNRPVRNTPYVFVSSSKNPGRHYGKPFTERRWFMSTLCKRAGIRSFGFHALRRYVASVLADTHKVSAKTIQRVLRHKHVMTTERYIKNINRDLSATMDLLSEKGPQEGSPIENKKG